MTIIAIDPGSTSTKVGVLQNNILVKETFNHDRKIIDSFRSIYEQKHFRVDIIKDFIEKKLSKTEQVKAVVGRGGLTKPIKGGVYRVNSNMLEDLKIGIMGQHAANLGGIIAKEIAEIYGCEAFITNPPVIDEMSDIAKVTGLKGTLRKSMFHALNQKSVALKISEKIGRDYKDINLIVAHLGGGISIGVHEKGEVTDVNNALDGDGPFSPERSGSIPVDEVIKLLKNGVYTADELKTKVSRKAGLYSYLGTTNLKEVEKMVDDGDKDAKLYYEAMAYQVAKEIGALATVVKGAVDGIILTGGLAFSEKFVKLISDRISFIGNIFLEPGENEIESLIDAGLRVATGKEEYLEYSL